MVVYIDVFFLYNFLIDGFLLYVTGKAVKVKTGARIAIGALVGGLYSAFAIIKGFELLGTFPIRLLVLFLMVFFSFRGGFLHCLKLSGVFVLNSFLFCGIMIFSSFLLGGDYIIVDNSPVFVSGYLLLFLSLLICLFFGAVTLRFLIKRITLRDIYKKVKISFGEKEVVLNAFVDTGNNLFDFENLCPVMLVNSEKVDLAGSRLHTMEISTVKGRGSLLCLEPRTVEIEKKNYKVTIGVPEEKIFGYDALLGANMFISEEYNV